MYKVYQRVKLCLFDLCEKSLLNENPSLVSAYRDAYAKSIKYAKENINELMVLDYSIDNIHACDLESAINREVPLWNENTGLDDDILANAVRELKREFCQGILHSRIYL